MRRSLILVAGVASILVATPAYATSLCDPDGHFCVQVDTTSAIACDLTTPGALDPRTCAREDLAIRDQVHAAQWPIFRALVLRFDDWNVVVGIAKHPAMPELSSTEIDAHAARVRAMAEAAHKLEAFAPPRTSRIHDVQVIRFDSVWNEGDHRVEEIDMEVHASQGEYMVSFEGPPGPRQAAIADSVIATLDTVPAVRTNGPGDALTWILRACVAAGVIAGILVWVSRRKGPSIDARTLWPR
jgi:hypothetical protein